MASILEHFDALSKQGMKIVPLYKNSKRPIGKSWGEKWSHDRARWMLQRSPEANIGLLLGDIVDVEGDSEQANQIILDLIKDYPHPCYRSTKSIHHLFLTPDPNLRRFQWNNIEFRGHGHQSVLPPSQFSGVSYKWLKNFRFPIPQMPEELVDFLENKNGLQKETLKPGHVRIRCGNCKNIVFLHKKRYALELKAFKLLGQKWECQDCRTTDIRSACRLIRAKVPAKVVSVNGFDLS